MFLDVLLLLCVLIGYLCDLKHFYLHEFDVTLTWFLPPGVFLNLHWIGWLTYNYYIAKELFAFQQFSPKLVEEMWIPFLRRSVYSN